MARHSAQGQYGWRNNFSKVLLSCVGLALLTTPAAAQAPRSKVATHPNVGNLPSLRFDPQQILRVAGTDDFFNGYGDDGPALDAALNNPWGIAVDAAGNIFIGLRGDRTVRRIDAVTGVITTVAGVAPSDSTGPGGGGEGLRHRVSVPLATHGTSAGVTPHVSATSVQLTDPQSIAIDSAGNLFIAATGDDVIYKVDSNRSITIYAGQQYTSGYAGDGGAATSALFAAPTGLTLDSSGNLFIADSNNNVIRRVDAATGIITTVAGSQVAGSGYSGDGSTATSAQLNKPSGTTVDATGNVFIADSLNNVVRKVTASTGVITTVAGNHTSGYSGDGGPATSARLARPYGLAVDGSGALYIADYNNSVVRRVNAAGVIATVAGVKPTGPSISSFTGDGGPATSAEIGRIPGVALDGAGNLFLTGSVSEVVLEVPATGGALDFGTQLLHTTGTRTLTLTNTSAYALTFTGYDVATGTGFSVDSSAAGACNLAGTLAAGASCTLAVRFTPSTAGFVNEVLTFTNNAPDSPQVVSLTGTGILSPVNVTLSVSPTSVNAGSPVTFDVAVSPVAGTSPVPSGQVVLTDYNSSSTIATLTLDSSGHASFTTSSLAAGSYDVVADYQGDTVYAENISSDRTFTVTPRSASISLSASATSINAGQSIMLTATITSSSTVSGSADFYVDGSKIGSSTINNSSVAMYSLSGLSAGNHKLEARFNNPVFTVAYSNVVSVIVHGAILQFQPAATYTIAGTPSDDLHGGFSGDSGPATSARMHTPVAVAVDGSNNVYIADEQNNVIRRVDGQTGIITTFAGIPYVGSIYSTRFGGDGGPATSAYLDNPSGLAFDPGGNLYIADYSNNVIRRVDIHTGIITTVAGVPNNGGYNGDSGTATTIRLNNAGDVAFDSLGNMYIADSGNNLIRKVDTAGNLTTIAGYYYSPNYTGPLATQTSLHKPFGITVDPSGNPVFADTYNNAVYRIDVANNLLVPIVRNNYTYAPYGDGGAATAASLSFPEHIAYDRAGNLYIADSSHYLIRRVDALSGIITTVAGINGGSNFGYGFDPAGTLATYTPLAAPYGIAIDNAGALYITDTYNQTVLKAGAPGVLLFGPQATGATSEAQVVRLSNAGDTSLTFGATPFTVNGDYAVLSSSSTTCNFAAALAPGASCDVGVTFTPRSTTYAGGTLSFNTDAFNSPQVVHLVSNSTKMNPTIDFQAYPDTVSYGDQVILYAQINGATVPPSGTFSFFSGSVNLGSASISGGYAYIYLTTLPVGVNSITAVYSGDSLYAGATAGPSTITVSKIATSTTLAVSSTSIAAGGSVGLTATVSSTSTAVPVTGTVTFLDGTATLGTQTLAVDGTASLITAALHGGANSITARYNGTATVAGSTSSAINVDEAGGSGGGGGGTTTDYVISAGPLPVVIRRGGTATILLDIRSLNSYQGSVHLECGALPAYATCTFSNTDVILAGPIQQQTVTMTVTTTALPAGTPLFRAQVVQKTGPHGLPTMVFAAP